MGVVKYSCVFSLATHHIPYMVVRDCGRTKSNSSFGLSDVTGEGASEPEFADEGD